MLLSSFSSQQNQRKVNTFMKHLPLYKNTKTINIRLLDHKQNVILAPANNIYLAFLTLFPVDGRQSIERQVAVRRWRHRRPQSIAFNDLMDDQGKK
jgi:hypothetical protein